MHVFFLSVFLFVFLRAQNKIQRICAILQINIGCFGVLELHWRGKEEIVNFFYTFILLPCDNKHCITSLTTTKKIPNKINAITCS